MELEDEWDPWHRRWLPPSADQRRIALWCTKQVNIAFYEKVRDDGEWMTFDPLPEVPILAAYPRSIESVHRIHHVVIREYEGVLPRLRIYGYDFPQDLHSIILSHGNRCLKQRRYAEGEERRRQVNANELIWDGEDVSDWSELGLLDDDVGRTRFVLRLVMHHEESEPVTRPQESGPVGHHEQSEPAATNGNLSNASVTNADAYADADGGLSSRVRTSRLIQRLNP